MENFEGAIGAITTGVLKAGLQPGTAIQLIVRIFFYTSWIDN